MPRRPGSPNHRPRPPLSEAERQLVAAYVPLARKLARYEAIRRGVTSESAEADELLAEALYTLVVAVPDYDPDRRQVRLATYLRHRIRWAWADRDRQRWRWRDRFCPIGHDVPAPDDTSADQAHTVEALLRYTRYPEVLRLRYVGGLTQEETGRQLGQHQSRVSKLERAALDEVRTAID